MTFIRQELLAALAELSAACPERRFGQLIANLSTLAKGLSAEGLWDAEDEELLAAARKQLAYFAERRPPWPNIRVEMSSVSHSVHVTSMLA
jgi:hypothetical protein